MAEVEKDERFYLTLVTLQVSIFQTLVLFIVLVAQIDNIGGELSIQGASTAVGIPFQDIPRHVFTPCSRRCRGVNR